MSNQYNILLVSQMSAPLNLEKNAELYLLVAIGNDIARRAMIEGNMPLVIAQVERFLHCCPSIGYLRDDLVSGGFLGLVNAVNYLAAGFKITNPTFYLAKSISTEIGKVMNSEMPLRMPYTSERRRKATGKALAIPTVVNGFSERFEMPSYEKELELRDLIDTCCCNDEERIIIAMREEEYTFDEIATALGRPCSSTYILAKELEARVQRKLEALCKE